MSHPNCLFLFFQGAPCSKCPSGLGGTFVPFYSGNRFTTIKFSWFYGMPSNFATLLIHKANLSGLNSYKLFPLYKNLEKICPKMTGLISLNWTLDLFIERFCKLSYRSLEWEYGPQTAPMKSLLSLNNLNLKKTTMNESPITRMPTKTTWL